MRDAIALLPAGTYRDEIWLDGFEEPLVIRCAVTVAGGKIHDRLLRHLRRRLLGRSTR